MQTEQDHVAAYKFATGRLASALVLGDPASPRIPAQRGRTGLAVGVVLAFLITGGLGVFGLIVPSKSANSAWRQPGTVVVDQETSTRYVLNNGQLHPTLNEASALLLAGSGAKVAMVSHSELADIPDGPAVGIVGAPDPVPTSAQLVAGPWLTCLSDTGPDGAQSAKPAMSVVLGGSIPDAPITPNQFALVTSSAGAPFVLWHDLKYPVGATAAATLGLATVQRAAAPDPWLAVLPTGPAIQPPAVADMGTQGPAVGGVPYPVGQLFQQNVPNGVHQRFVLLHDGLAPLSATGLALLAAAPGAATPVTLTSSVVAATPLSTNTSLLHSVPDVLDATAVDAGSSSLCVRQQVTDQHVSSVIVLAGVPATPPGVPAAVAAPPGSGMVVTPVSEASKPVHEFLITDQGLKFPLADSDSIEALGLADVRPVPMPDALIAAIPAGPLLSRAAAATPPEG